MSWEIIHGECIETMRAMEPNSIDCIVCDPPYGLGFMGRKWDALPPGQGWAEACARVLKPGGHVIAFGGTRTVHRLAVAIEDGGMDIRDCITWNFWSGFPKSLDVSKAIDRAAGAEREVLAVEGRYNEPFVPSRRKWIERQITAPATEAAKRWAGFGTALKPCYEPAVLARKPPEGTIAANVLKWGVGALNVDGCRMAYGDPAWPGPNDETGSRNVPASESRGGSLFSSLRGERFYDGTRGRWPGNIYACAKPSPREREAGCYGLPARSGADAVQRAEGSAGMDNPRAGAGRTADAVRNVHPTVKPVGVLRWLCRLVCPPGGLVLDPFAGSGSCGIAAIWEGFDYIGIERENTEEQPFADIARARIAWAEGRRPGDFGGTPIDAHPDQLELLGGA